jgi:ubiquinone/menaquinone biosynthesis C-methylase UbiE
MYQRSAEFYDRLYHFKDYASASRQLVELIDRSFPAARTLLDVACGTGRHLEHLRARFGVEGLDINPTLLATARRRCPDVAFHLGDMTDFDLGRTFDVVTCLFSAIAYVKTAENLFRAVARLAAHSVPGGMVIVEPFFSPERFWVNHLVLNVSDEPDLKIAWMYTTEREGALGRIDVHHLVGRRSGVEHFRELHEFGLFTDAEYEQAFIRAGLTPSYDPTGPFGRGIYIARKAPVPV